MALDDKIINLDINKTNILNLSAKQYDTTGARSFTFRLLKDGQIYNLTNLTVRVGGTKADNTTIFNDCTIVDAKNGTVRVDLTTQMQVIAGNLNLELIIMQGTTRLSTVPFTINIIKSATNLNNVVSSNELESLSTALNTSNEYASKLKEGTEKIELQYANKLNNIDAIAQKKYIPKTTAIDDSEIASINFMENKLGQGTIILSNSIKYTKENSFTGTNWAYKGTILKPISNFPVFEPDTTQSIDYTRNQFYGLMLDGTNINENNPILILNKSFLTTFEKCFFANGGDININDSDSIRFIDCRFMDGKTKNVNINIGAGARSINFIGCNFENYNDKKCIINIKGTTNAEKQLTTNINFTNCQSERAEFNLDNCSNCIIDASKLHRTKIVLGKFTNNCKVINVADATSIIIDLGKDNIIENFVGQNVAGFNISKYRLKSDFTATDKYYGENQKEYLFISSIFPNSFRNVTNGKISYFTSSGTYLDITPKNNFLTDMTTLGSGIRQSYTDFKVFKNLNNTVLVKASADSGDNTVNFNVILKENKITNGEFRTVTTLDSKWSLNNLTASINNNKLSITTVKDEAFKLTQNLENLDENKCYMAIMQSDKPITMCIGNVMNGTQGARKCASDSVQVDNNIYISQLFFTNIKNDEFSIGSINSVANDTIKIDFIAVVELN